jgi:arylsulfatase
MAEVFAGFSEYTDHQVGRIVDYLEESGQLENTIVLYCADNGASGEGTPNGSVNENLFFNGWPDDIQENLRQIDDLGSPSTYNHYPTGWAVAFSTPFKMFKRYSYAGGTCDPLVIHWPAGIKARGEVRHQYHHVTDIVPTILECCGLEFPTTLNGHEQVPLAGVSMRYSFDEAAAETQKERQYYAMLGTRGMWENGWKAVAVHGPLSGIGNYDHDEWELFNLEEDRAEARNLAGEHPDKLEQLIARWFEEADKYNVLPLDDRFPPEILNDPRPQPEEPRDTYVYYPGTAEVPEVVAVSTRGRSYKILADVELTSPDAEGVIFAHGSRFGGHALFLKDQKLWYVYNFLGLPPEQQFVSDTLGPAKYVLGMEFTKESTGERGESLGTTKLYVDEEVVAEGPMRTQLAFFTLCGDGLCVGRDSGDAVSKEYTAPATFKGGTILQVEVSTGDDQYLDLEKEAHALLARE